MSREIKFRGRRVDYQVWPDSPNIQWVRGLYFTAPLTDENSGMHADAGWYFLSGGDQKHCIVQDGTSFVVDPETVGEWSGLLDKNGAEIFEGDIVELDGDIYIVRFQIGAFGLEKKGETRGHLYHYCNFARIDHSPYVPTVIGNVHDNPELLERLTN